MEIKNGLIFKNMPCPFYSDPENSVECKKHECVAYQPKRKLSEREVQGMHMADIPVMSEYTNSGYCAKYDIDEYIVVDSVDGKSLWKDKREQENG